MTGAPAVPEGRIVLVRHGKTEWSESGQHTGTTDIPLTPKGEEEAQGLAEKLAEFEFGLVLSSSMQRARRTAEIAGRTPEIDDNLMEWDYGGYEGRTTADIREELGYDWSVFEHGVVPGETPGETVEEVAARGSRVLLRAMPVLSEGKDVLLFGHGHALRILTATFLREEPRFGAKILLDAGSVSVLEYEREQPAIRLWNSR
ncbi:putative phosphoglycerate mutase [Knoellia remsis]|uniref:Putative phosphoglycerate mutase n=1 Tax=Knoellia remsis TaxID=407159 RepID=A0A2T0U0G1_9MICO|nr:histidine phosphatase family protein [Knoellia remsis]PRY51404.1 putative phosphoglycerate mutase [Knoellia remsis]